MTDREKAIVMAYTGKCMLTGNKFQIFHKYVEEIMGRPVMTHEIGWLADAIKEKAKADFIALCADESSSEKPNKWIPVSERYPTDINKEYLVCYEDGFITIEFLLLDGDGHPFFSYDDVIKSIKGMPSVTPQYTEAEIQRMQELEQAEIQKAYELGKADAEKVGHWIDGKCNKCGTHAPYWAMASTYYCSKYCPECGAKMQEVEA